MEIRVRVFLVVERPRSYGTASLIVYSKFKVWGDDYLENLSSNCFNRCSL